MGELNNFNCFTEQNSCIFMFFDMKKSALVFVRGGSL